MSKSHLPARLLQCLEPPTEDQAHYANEDVIKSGIRC